MAHGRGCGELLAPRNRSPYLRGAREEGPGLLCAAPESPSAAGHRDGAGQGCGGGGARGRGRARSRSATCRRARLGTARYSPVRLDTARYGSVQPSMARHGSVWPGTARHGSVRHGSAAPQLPAHPSQPSPEAAPFWDAPRHCRCLHITAPVRPQCPSQRTIGTAPARPISSSRAGTAPVHPCVPPTRPQSALKRPKTAPTNPNAASAQPHNRLLPHTSTPQYSSKHPSTPQHGTVHPSMPQYTPVNTHILGPSRIGNTVMPP